MRLHACGVCHTDLYSASGTDPSGYAPWVLGHEGAGVVEAVGRDVRLVAPGDHVVTLFSPQCGQCAHCPQPAHEPLPGGPRAAEPRLPARRDDAAVARGRAPAPLHGHVDLRRGDRHARDRPGQDPRGGAARPRVPVRLRPVHRAGRRAHHGEGGAGQHLRRVRRGDGRPGCRGGARLAGAERVVCVDLSDDRLELARGQGTTTCSRAAPTRSRRSST